MSSQHEGQPAAGPDPAAMNSAWAPFASRAFLWLWLANTVSALGTWIQNTTSAWIMRHLLTARHSTAMIGTLGVWLDVGGAVAGSESLTTPGPVDLARLFRTLLDRGVSAIAMEVSSHALDQGRVDALRLGGQTDSHHPFGVSM